MKSLLFEGFKSYYKKLEEETHRRNPIYLYRGTSERTFSKNFKPYAGLFFSTKRSSVTGWGNTKKYLLRSDAKIYNKEESSGSFCQNNGYCDKEYKELKECFGMYFGDVNITKISDFTNLKFEESNKLEDAVEEIAGNNFCWYDIIDWCSQLVAKIELEKQGYDGAYWTHEDYGNPEQYQIWNFDVLKSYEGVVESIDDSKLDERILYRGECDRNYSNMYDNFAGKFFYGDSWEYLSDKPEDEYDQEETEYGFVVKYELDDDAKIYKYISSEKYVKDNKLWDIKDKVLTYFIVEAEGLDDSYLGTPLSINDLVEMEHNGEAEILDSMDGNCWWAMTQYIARKDLEKKGYDGAEWMDEDDLYPHQIQLWNLDKIHKVVKNNESLKEDNESSKEYDSEGNQLTTEQEEYFKDSKIRDENGNLLVCYHNTPYDFKSFDKSKIGSGNGGASFGKGFYFSIGDNLAGDYDGDYQIVCYLNITNPFDYYNGGCSIDVINKLLSNSNYKYHKDWLERIFDKYEISDEDLEEYSKEEIFEGLMEDYDLIDNTLDDILIDDNPYEVFSEMVKNAGYDGIIAGEEVIAFEPNQIKRISNTNPTSKDDMNEEI